MILVLKFLMLVTTLNLLVVWMTKPLRMNRSSLGQEELLSQLSTVIILYILDITLLLIL